MNWGGDGKQFGDTSMSSFNSPGAGGGFLDKTFGESPASQSKKGKKKQGTVPITAAGIHNAQYETVIDSFMLNEVPLRQITLVGMVSSVTENRTSLSFEIDDLTGGTVTVRRWIDQDDSPEEYEEARFREDSYVRAYGYIKRGEDDKRHVIAFTMHEVTDFNEIIYHMVHVIHSHLSLRKRIRGEKTSAGNTTTGNFGNSSFSAQRDQFGSELGGMSKAENRVYQMVNQDISPEGIYVGDLVRKLNMTEQSVREALEHLSNEGHIYSTTDDDHFKSTNAGDA